MCRPTVPGGEWEIRGIVPQENKILQKCELIFKQKQSQAFISKCVAIYTWAGGWTGV